MVDACAAFGDHEVEVPVVAVGVDVRAFRGEAAGAVPDVSYRAHFASGEVNGGLVDAGLDLPRVRTCDVGFVVGGPVGGGVVAREVEVDGLGPGGGVELEESVLVGGALGVFRFVDFLLTGSVVEMMKLSHREKFVWGWSSKTSVVRM